MCSSIKGNNILTIGRTGTPVSTINDISIEEYKWEEGVMVMYDFGSKKNYKIYIFSNDERLLIRPKEKYTCKKVTEGI